MDWTDFDADGQATIMLSLLTRHGRATPLLWLTVDTATLKDNHNEYGSQVFGPPRRRPAGGCEGLYCRGPWLWQPEALPGTVLTI